MITNHSYMFYQFRKELCETLSINNEVLLSTPFVGREDELKNIVTKLIETNVDRRGINPIKDFSLLKEYYSLIKKEKPDLVITYSIKPNIYASIICSLLNIPTYVNVQGLGTAFQTKFLSIIVTILYKFALRKAKVVFFENHGNANEFINRKIIPNSKIKVLKGAGVNLDNYEAKEYKNDELVHFLFVGRIMKEKGVEELFYAIQKLKQEYSNIVLDMIGFFEDEYKPIVDKLVEKKIVNFHGFQSDPKPFYENAHCVVLPSYHEGMSNVLLEASAMSRAIITSNIHGCKEACDHGINGYLVNVQDKEDLYVQMKQFMELTTDQRKTLGLNGRRKMEKEFDKKIIVKETIDSIFEGL